MSKEKVEAKSLFDYIDNLQQAKDKLQNDYQNVVNIINELQQENKQLKEDKRKAIEYIKRTIKIIKEQPSSCELNDIWTLEHLNSFLEILGDKE